jgi:glycosyltransferase involved in cell wall biosynthesis
MGNSGVTYALWSWARAQAAAGAEVHVLHAPQGEPTSDVPFVSKDFHPAVTTQCVPHRGRHRMTLRPIRLDRYLGRRDLLVLHTGWVPGNLLAAAAARRAGVPYIVMPHGVYERLWTTYLRGPRRIRDYFERRFLERAAAVHVFFDSEIDDIKALAPGATFFTVPTGFDLPRDRWAGGGGGYLAWMGRIDPVHKGLDMLVRAIARLTPGERPALHFRGYDYKGGVAGLQRLIAEHGLGNWVRLEPAVAGAEKARFMHEADGYVHPSRWECHSIALLEHLALGVPCVVSNTIHIARALERSRAAVLAAPCEPDLAAALTRLPSERRGVAERGRALIGEAFNWGTLVPQFQRALARLGLT